MRYKDPQARLLLNVHMCLLLIEHMIFLYQVCIVILHPYLCISTNQGCPISPLQAAQHGAMMGTCYTLLRQNQWKRVSVPS